MKKKIHILEVDKNLTSEQYKRLLEQTELCCGRGNFIILEAGVKYRETVEIEVNDKPQAGLPDEY